MSQDDTEGDGIFVDGSGNIVREDEIVRGDFTGDSLYGAADERAVEQSGDADVGRGFQRNKMLFGGWGDEPTPRRTWRDLPPARLPEIPMPSSQGHRNFIHRAAAPTTLAPVSAKASVTEKNLKQLIRRQLVSGVVSKALVSKWASVAAGSEGGPQRRAFYDDMKAQISRRGAVISKDKPFGG